MGKRRRKDEQGKQVRGGKELCILVGAFILLLGFWSTVDTPIVVIQYWLSRDSYEARELMEPRVVKRDRYRGGSRTVVEGRINGEDVWLHDRTITSQGVIEGPVSVLYSFAKAETAVERYNAGVLPLRFARVGALMWAIAHIITVLLLMGTIWWLVVRIRRKQGL